MKQHLNTDQEFGQRLRAERERLGLEVHELAHLCGRTDHTQRRYEDGKESLPIDYIQALFRRTDINVQYIVSGSV